MPSSSDSAGIRSRFPVWLLAVLLALVTLALYWPATRCDFVNYDDNIYVTENPHVQNGLSWSGVKWVFCDTQQAVYWAPMVWLSHQLACQLFGLNPWGHHLINVLLHAANTVLVFLLFRRLTGATWRSLMVAVLFGWHPLRVESVAWVTERKDVLSTFFGLLSLLCYAKAVTGDKWQVARTDSNLSRACQSEASGRRLVTCHVSPYYFLSLFFFVVGLMSKAMLVTWPFVMLLLDWWPFGRFKIQGSRSGVLGLVLEKGPFFALAVGASIVTYLAQRHGGAVMSVESLPLEARIGNALISYCRYLGKLFWPVGLAVYYPLRGHWPVEEVLLAGGLLVGITVLCVAMWRRYPFMLVGWFWFVGTLVPVIQLVQAGGVAIADRFTYIPSLGLLLLIIWSVYELTCRWRYQGLMLTVASCTVSVLCLLETRQQLGYWQDSEALFRHTLTITPKNYLAHNNLGTALLKKDQIDEAISQFQETIRLAPDYVNAYNNLGIALGEKGRLDEAINQLRAAIRLKPDFGDAHDNLGIALGRQGQMREAITQFREAVRLNPDYADVHNNLGIALGRNGQVDEAISQFQEAVRLNPGYIEAKNNLARALEIKSAAAGH
jgi:Flp pilus assembly protein TadD